MDRKLREDRSGSGVFGYPATSKNSASMTGRRNPGAQMVHKPHRYFKPKDPEPVLVPFQWKGPHPLLLTHVMENMFKDLPLRDLNSCMKVCKDWKNVAAKVKKFRESLVLRINPSNAKDFQTHLDALLKSPFAAVDTLSLVGLPIRRANLPWRIVDRIGSTLDTLNLFCCRINTMLLAEFLMGHAKRVRVLVLRSIALTNKSQFGNDEANETFGNKDLGDDCKGLNWLFQTLKMPELEQLTIFENPREDYKYTSIVNVMREPDHRFLPVDITLLMTAFRNLKTLTLRCNIRAPKYTTVPNKVRFNTNWERSLRTLHVEPIKVGREELDIRIFDTLAGICRSLTKIHIDPWYLRSTEYSYEQYMEAWESLQLMLKNNANALNDVSIMLRHNSVFQRYMPSLPVFLSNVQALTLTANLLHSFDELESLPKLKHFEIQGVPCDDLDTVLKTATKSFPNVQGLKIIHRGPQNFGQFQKIFPNIRALDLTMDVDYCNSKRMDNVNISMVAHYFPGLEFLRMRAVNRGRGRYTEFECLGISEENRSSGIWANKESSYSLKLGLKDMPNLRLLDLYPMAEALDEIALLKKLEILNLSRSKVNLYSLVPLVRKLPALKLLRMEMCPSIGIEDVKVMEGWCPMVQIEHSMHRDSEKLECDRNHTRIPDDHLELLCNCEKTVDVKTG